MITYLKQPYLQEDVEAILHPYVKEWFFSKFKEFSLPQLYGVKEVHEKNNLLVIAGTGGTKTLTSFLAILNELVVLATKHELKDKVYAVYISPLKALNYDIGVNLEQPLQEINIIAQRHGHELGIRVGVRTGDTTPYERQKMLNKPPHILITTPESLALMLSSIKFKELLRDITWTILDEVHALCDNKRGVHLSLSIERLQDIAPAMARIGLSATVEPVEDIAHYLVGEGRICKIAQVPLTKKFDLQVLSPLPNLIDTTYEKLHKELYRILDELIQNHKTTLIFTNTRAGTERVVHHLKTLFPSNYIENIEAHHGSLSKTHRFAVEKKLREGKLRAVVCSTSLELGLDIGYIDLVICLGSPKSVARLLQRCLPYDSPILLADGSYLPIGEIVEKKLQVPILSYDCGKKQFVSNNIARYHKNPGSEMIDLNFHSGTNFSCTPEHPIMTREGWKKAKDLVQTDEVAELFDYNVGERPYIYKLINHKEFYLENRDDFLRNVVDEFVHHNKISYASFANRIGIDKNHLQNYLRRHGRKKGIRLDIFLKIMNLCKINEEDYILYFKELKSKSHHRRPLPLRVDKELMWLAGIVASDGSITQHKRTKELKIKIGNKDKKLLEECQNIFQQYGFFPKILSTRRDRTFFTLDCGSKLLAQIFLSFGLTTKNKSRDISISNVLYKMPKSLIIPFIEGVMEGDGNVTHQTIRIFTISPAFAQGLHNLLNRCSIHNYIAHSAAKPSRKIKKINYRDMYILYIGRKKHITDFVQHCLTKCKKSVFLASQKIIYTQKETDISYHTHWTKIKEITISKTKEPVYNLTLCKRPNTYFVQSVLTHNCGRAGHRLHDTVKGRVIVLDRDDLVECAVLLKNALEKKIDRAHIPTNCLDVLAQQIYGMAVADRWNVKDVYGLIKKSYCYRDLSYTDFMELIHYLAGDYGALEERHVYAKIWHDEKTGEIAKRGSQGKLIYMTNVGTIPDQTGIIIKVGEHPIGTVDEGFLERLQKGDVFVLGGNTYEFQFARGMTAQVRAAPGKQPTVPSWFSEMLPLSFDLASSIQLFRRNMEDLFVNTKNKEHILDYIRNYLSVDEHASNAIYTYFQEQYLYAGIPHDRKMIVEFFSDEKSNKKYVVFHSLYGRRVNDVLSRALGFIVSKLSKHDIEVGITDNGFYLASEKPMQVLRGLEVLQKEDLQKVMTFAIEKTEVLRRRFRHCAGRALMILRLYKGQKKTVGKQQVSSMILMHAVKRINPNFCILKEARREVLEDLMDIKNATAILEKITKKIIEIKQVHHALPSPFAFQLATQGATDVLQVEDKMAFLRRMHRNVLAKIGKTHILEHD
ncbi:MAG: DEAD/DEAH box helicase [Nanoarchaeota archaeon]